MSRNPSPTTDICPRSRFDDLTETALRAISGAARYRNGVWDKYRQDEVLTGDSEADWEAWKAAVHILLEECFSGFREIGCCLPETVLPMYLDDVGQAERAAFHVFSSCVDWDDQAKMARGLLDEVHRKWLPLFRGAPPTGAEDEPAGRNTPFAGLLSAIVAADLSKTQAKVVRVVAEKNGIIPIVDANTLCDCDALSAFKRAGKKLRKYGWLLHEKHSSLSAEPLKKRGRN